MRNLLAILFCLILPACVMATPFAAYDVFGDHAQIEYVQVCQGGMCRLVPVQRAVNLVRNAADRAIGLDGDGGLQSVLAYDVCGCGCGISGCTCNGSKSLAVDIGSRARTTVRNAVGKPLSIAKSTAGRVRNLAHRAIFHRRR